MWKRLGIATGMAVITAALWITGTYYTDPVLQRGFVTAVAITSIYVVGKLIIEELAVDRVAEAKTRYVVRKSVSILSIAAGVLAVFTIWVADPAALFVAYGLVGAGVAIALQDVFKNFVGGITAFLSGIYQVGDRVQIGDVTGDVIDIGLMYTKVLEIQGWVQGDQATGRIVMVPNGAILGGAVTNYTVDNSFIWEEISIPITYDSDWRAARETILDIVGEATAERAERASHEIEQIQQKYYLSRRDTDPQVFLELTDNWVTFHVRYITDVRKRRRATTAISEDILAAVEKMDDVTIASQTIDIVGFPGTDGSGKD